MTDVLSSHATHEHPCGHDCLCGEPGAQWCDRCEIAEVMLRRHHLSNITRGQALARLYMAMRHQLGELEPPMAEEATCRPTDRSPLERLVDAAAGSTLAYSDRVEVRQDDLRLVLGAYWEGGGSWVIHPTYVDQLAVLRTEYRRDSAERFARAAGQRF